MNRRASGPFSALLASAGTVLAGAVMLTAVAAADSGSASSLERLTQSAPAPAELGSIGPRPAPTRLRGNTARSGSDPSPPELQATASPAATATAGTYTPCRLDPTRIVFPLEPAKEDEVTLTLGLRAICNPDDRPLHVVLVVEATDRMGDVQVEKLSGALRDALQELQLEERPYLRVGVVTIGDGKAQVRSFLSSDESRVLNALPDREETGGDQCVHCGLQEALRVLWNGREGRAQEELREAILLATAGVDQSGCDALQRSADNLKAFGALVVTACVGRSCEQRCLSEAASQERFAFRSWDWSFVGRRFSELVESTGPSFYPVESVSMEDWLAEGKLTYTRGGEPSEGVGNKLVWHFAPFPETGVTRTYYARAITCGRFRASEEPASALVDFNDTFWAEVGDLSVQFANPVLDVPCAVPPTLTPTAEPSWTPPATATSTATPVVTPSRPGSDLYFPSLHKLACALSRGPVDVMFAIDVSGSMLQRATRPSDGTRLELSKRIAFSMLDYLEAEDSRAGVVVYGDEELIQVVAPLADCCGTARLALDSLPFYNGSRVDLALERAEAELRGPAARQGASQVVIVLTDGDLNQTPTSRLIEVATRARARGVSLHIVGVGPDARDAANLFIAAAGARSRLHLAYDRLFASPEVVLGPVPLCRR